ncbi:MAG: T9SS C-terminal target domain-containing protein [Bacteroidetes bacterium]|nr:MAG: T9SS C-terminal target domain-containing protein [Bacteroidota bacterium]REK00643.1 MAG: T9SS C-terminal target domain-containing protein [Bacteroidota bacterium]REK35235.1 MAG: T9SS C-terminal target domain-containing protein [Bacteroidota bacterium]REK48312.1 MAG: T9SS C-terminal target domain-containing protein [Bacteroidota bacterium]
MSGSSGGLNPACTPDNEITQNVMWMAVTATTTSFTIENKKAYVGSGANNANTKDYVVYSGTCGSLTQIACYTLGGNANATVTGLTAGQVYYIMASPSSLNTTADAISVAITSTVGYTPPGNACASAPALVTNTTYTLTNAGATVNGPICSGSVENNVWYQWCAPSNWPSGQAAYVSVFNQICNSSQGLQLTVWNTNSSCPGSAASPTLVCQNPGSTTQYYYQWTPTANQCYYITIDGYAGTACQYRLTVGSLIVLPIELIRFDAKVLGNSVHLTWATASEINNHYFTLEKSKDGSRFIPLAEVPGAGNSTTLRNYAHEDPFPFSGVNYYRIRQTDMDGQFSYSSIIAVNVKDKGNVFSAWQNTASGSVGVIYFSTESTIGRLRMIDINGRQVYNMDLHMDTGRNDFKIDRKLFSAGVYVIILETEDEVMRTSLSLSDDL